MLRFGTSWEVAGTWKWTEFRSANKDKMVVTGWCRSDGGHLSEFGARECYQRFRIENVITFTNSDDDLFIRVPTQRCAVCKGQTNGYASEYGYHLVDLCNKHLEKECVRSVLGKAAADYRYDDWQGSWMRPPVQLPHSNS